MSQSGRIYTAGSCHLKEKHKILSWIIFQVKETENKRKQKNWIKRQENHFDQPGSKVVHTGGVEATFVLTLEHVNKWAIAQYVRKKTRSKRVNNQVSTEANPVNKCLLGNF